MTTLCKGLGGCRRARNVCGYLKEFALADLCDT